MRNIQKHPVKPGQYIGNATGTWQIKRVGKGKLQSWRGVKVSGEKFVCDPPAITGKTLAEISQVLIELDTKIAAEVAAHDRDVAAVAAEMAMTMIAKAVDQIEASSERDRVLPNAFMNLEGK